MTQGPASGSADSGRGPLQADGRPSPTAEPRRPEGQQVAGPGPEPPPDVQRPACAHPPVPHACPSAGLWPGAAPGDAGLAGGDSGRCCSSPWVLRPGRPPTPTVPWGPHREGSGTPRQEHMLHTPKIVTVPSQDKTAEAPGGEPLPGRPPQHPHAAVSTGRPSPLPSPHTAGCSTGRGLPAARLPGGFLASQEGLGRVVYPPESPGATGTGGSGGLAPGP